MYMCEMTRKPGRTLAMMRQHAAKLAAIVSKRVELYSIPSTDPAPDPDVESAPPSSSSPTKHSTVCMLALSNTEVTFRVGVYDDAWAAQFDMRRDRTLPPPPPPASFMKMYTIGPFDLAKPNQLSRFCAIIIALGRNLRELRDQMEKVAADKAAQAKAAEEENVGDKSAE
jgi:hypothetical protein